MLFEGPVDGLRNECSFSRRQALSSSQLVPYKLLEARPLMMTVFKSSINFPTDVLSFDPQHK